MESVSETMKAWMNSRNLNENYRQLMAETFKDPDVISFFDGHQDELADDYLDRSASKIYEFVNEKKKVAEGKPGFAPGYEPKLVVNNHLVEVAYVPTEATQEAQIQQAARRRVATVSMPKSIRDAHFGDFDASEDDRLMALNDALDFVQAFVATPTKWHQGLYLQGSFGVGKTYLLGAIANNLAEKGFRTTLVHFPSFAVDMKNSIGDNKVAERLNVIKKAPILMIDDIGADAMSAWIRDEVLGVILEYRMQEELPTFFSSNFSMNQLEKEHLAITSRGDEEPLKAKRIMERIRFLSREVQMVGKNRRPH